MTNNYKHEQYSGGDHLSNATCVTHAVFKSGEHRSRFY